MERKIVLGLMPTLLVAGILTLTFIVSSVTASLSVPPLTPAFDYDDGLTRPDILDGLSEGSTPGYGDTSEYLIGDVAVGVIFLESNGSVDEPSTEDWTSNEESEVISEITAGLSWLASQNPDADVSFTLDIHYRILIGCEPINYPSGHQEHWIMEAMTYLGFPPYPIYSYHRQVLNYVNDLRNTLGTDWAYAMFIVDSSDDPDGKFTDGWFAYAEIGGPFLVMTYDNGGFGIGNMDKIAAHETCHIFYATDEYNGKTEYSGYLNVVDNEDSGDLMDTNAWWLCTNSREQLGWRDSDGDGIQDIVDTFPDTTLNPYSPNPTIDTILTYTGSIVEIPYPNNNPRGTGNNVTINTITNVEFRVDFGSWISATPTDGAFDEDEENFTFTTPPLSEGTHTIETRGINSVGNIEISYAFDEVTILERAHVHNLNTGLNYSMIQQAIDAPETLDGHTILVDAGTYYENVIVNKTVSLIGGNRSTTIIDGNSSGTILKIVAENVSINNFTIQNSGTEQWNGKSSGILIYKSNGNDISQNIITNNSCGITLWYSNNNVVEGNLISQNDLGISLTRSNGNMLSGNTISDSMDGIIIRGRNNTLADNKVLSNTQNGIYIGDTEYNVLSNNNVSYNECGIMISFSNNNTLVDNVISNNFWGIDLSWSENNTLIGNYVHSNNQYGIQVHRGSNIFSNNNISNHIYGIGIIIGRAEGNLFYHNNFIGNMLQVKPYYYGYSNFWDDGYPSGGNFWGYSGNDEYSGPDQDQPGSDGICDGPYVINVDNRDNYPLRNPWPKPVSSFVYAPSAPLVGETVTFNASGSYARDGYIVSYEWDFDDGNTTATSNPTIGHTYTIAGTYTVTLTVTDNDGLTDYATESIDVGRLNSTISISASPTTITIGENTTISGFITPTREGVTVTIWYRLGYSWSVLTNVATDENSEYSYTWTPSESGTYELKASWLGDENTFGAESSTITVTRLAPPVASFTYSPTIPSIGEEITFNASLSYDVDEDIASYWWDFDDGNISSTVDPTIVHTYMFPKTYNVTLTVIDAASLNSSISQTVSVKMPTSLSILTSSPSTFVGFKVNITGTLRDLYGNGLGKETVVLHYTLSGIGTWTPITSDTTDNLGNYFTTWIPPATGYFIIKADWMGNATHFGVSNTTTLSILAYKDQYVFSVESNSTISELTFNTKNLKLSFTATGPDGTRGYVKVTVAKSLVANITNIRVFLDGRQSEFSITSMDDSWLLTFAYEHSVHEIEVDLDITITEDTSSPVISVLLPENKTYDTSDIPLAFTVSEPTSWIGYSLDGQVNVTISGNTTIVGLSDGAHTITVYANDTAGNMGYSNTVNFTIQTTPIDTTPPSISIVSPQNKTYDTTDIPLTFVMNESALLTAYSLDNNANVTVAGNTTLSGLSDGSHSLVVYAKDVAGNTGASEMVNFSVVTQQPEPQPEPEPGEPSQLWIVAVIVIIVGVAVAVTFYMAYDLFRTSTRHERRQFGD